MKAATAKEIRKELKERSTKELLDYCLRLSRFKKENKELLTYLLFESDNEESYRRNVMEEVDEQFTQLNPRSYYQLTKSVRRILRNLRKFIRYSGNKETEVELLLHFCKRLEKLNPGRYTALFNLYQRTIAGVEKKIGALHEDLQYDHYQQLRELK